MQRCEQVGGLALVCVCVWPSGHVKKDGEEEEEEEEGGKGRRILSHTNFEVLLLLVMMMMMMAVVVVMVMRPCLLRLCNLSDIERSNFWPHDRGVSSHFIHFHAARVLINLTNSNRWMHISCFVYVLLLRPRVPRERERRRSG